MSTRKAYTAIFIFSFLSIFCSGWYWLYDLDCRTKQLASHKQEVVKKQMVYAQQSVETLQTDILSSILSRKRVKEAFAKKDRNELYALVRPTFEILQKQNPHFKVLHFHDERQRSFLRVHEPQKFGDELGSYRKAIVAAQTQMQKKVGFETGVTPGMMFRVIMPVEVDSRLIGSVEIGMDICYFAQEIRKVLIDTKMAILIKKEALREAKNNGCEYSFGDYCTAGKECVAFLKSVEKEFSEGKKEVKSGDTTVYLDDSFLVQDFSGKQIGLILCGVDISSAVASSRLLLLQDVTAAILQTLAVALFVYWLFLQHNKQILAKNRELDELNEQLNRLNTELEERVEQQLSEIQAQEELIHHHAKLASMTLMMSSVAHHWRQPLNIVSLILQEVCNSYEDRYMSVEDVAKSKETALRQIQKMSQTIDDFRNFFRVNEDNAEFWAKKFIQDGINIAQLQLKSIDLEPSVEGEDIYLFGAPHAFAQTVFALLINARDAIEQSKTLEPFIKVRLSKNENFGIIEVEDNAGGVPVNIMEHLFEPYFTTKEQGKGIGIGLYVAKLYIEQSMGGSLNVQNTQNGAKFTIMLPLVKG